MSVSKPITGTTLAVLIVALTVMPVFAEKTTPATDKNTAVPAVPRAIPDLIPYHKFDPPTSKMFDIKNLTISGDIRVRPEFRNSSRFGLTTANLGTTGSTAELAKSGKNNSFFVQQWARLGLHYTVSPDVVFFFQPQYSKNWGSGQNSLGGDPNTTDGTIFARQAYMLVRNFLTPDLTVKAGRQLVVWGNHRMFGHFDWNNVGWAFDGVTANYKLNAATTLQAGWLRVDETNCGSVTSGGCGVTGGNGVDDDTNVATSDSDVIYVRAPMQVMGMTVEPTYIWHNGGTGGGINAPRPPEQSRHTLGGRLVKKMNLADARLDSTIEGYYQVGEIGDGPNTDGRDQDISAFAFHVDGGVTLPVPMQPRIGGEFNMASGNSDDDDDWGSFDQLYPTNHIHFGYMDRMSWKNMVHYSLGLQLRPSKDSHFEISGHWFYLKEESDNWYGASQGAFILSPDGNQEDSLGNEIDVVYTRFFTPGNHVGWQIGGGVFFPGDFVDSNPAASPFNDGGDAATETWGYTQLWINF